MAFDAHTNLAISTVVTAPSPGTSGTSLTVTASEGARFPAPPFNATVWPSTAMPTPANAEVVRVTARTTDTLTIARAQEGTTARAMAAGDLIAASITAKTLTDLETQAALKDAANVFTQPQTLAQPAQPANERGWLLKNEHHLEFQPATDAGAGLINTLLLTRTGDAYVYRDLYEKGRATALGHWQTGDASAYAWSAGFTGPVQWTLIGKTCCLTVVASGNVAGGAYHRFTIPAGQALGALAAAASLIAPGQGGWHWGTAQFTAAGGTFDVYQADNVAWPAGVTYIQLAVVFPIL